VVARLGALKGALDQPSIAPSVASVVRALLLLRAVRKGLEPERSELRDVLLRYVDDGYLLRHARFVDGVRATFAYKAAMAALARGADLEPFTTRRRRLSLRVRNPASCRALFG
jgi:hypothetical protein